MFESWRTVYATEGSSRRSHPQAGYQRGLRPRIDIRALPDSVPAAGRSYSEGPSSGHSAAARRSSSVSNAGAAEFAPCPAIAVMSGGMSSLEAGTAAVLGAPYSGIRTTTILSGDKIVLKHITRFFRDSHGRTRLEFAFLANSNVKSPPVITTVTINDPVSGEMYTLQPEQKTVVVSPLPGSRTHVIQPPVTPPTPSGLPRAACRGCCRTQSPNRFRSAKRLSTGSRSSGPGWRTTSPLQTGNRIRSPSSNGSVPSWA
jgi:hypothetical protein